MLNIFNDTIAHYLGIIAQSKETDNVLTPLIFLAFTVYDSMWT